MEKDIKIAFFDVDGTMVDMKKKEITPKMIETLKKLQENGVKICIATGRPPRMVPKFPGVDFDAFLSFNGSYCYTEEKVIFENPIPTKDVLQITENSKKIGLPVSVSNVEFDYANGKDTNLVEYFAIAKQEVNVSDEFEEKANGKIYQMMIGCCPEQYEDVLRDAPGAQIAAWWNRAVDIIPSSGHKGVGVEKILEYYHLTKEQAIAFGDGGNDIQMLQAVGTGIAMGNALDSVKEIADDVCGKCSEDGIYHYCKEQGWID